MGIKVGDMLYRYEAYGWNIGDPLVLQEWKVIRETPGTYVLELYDTPRVMYKRGRQNFAKPTKELALESFIARKRRQHKILTHQLSDCGAQLRFATGMAIGTAAGMQEKTRVKDENVQP